MFSYVIWLQIYGIMVTTLMSHVLLRHMVTDIRNHGYYSLIIDETSNVSRTEQISICIRHIDANFCVFEDFIGL